MVNTLLIIMRKVSNLEAYITVQHIELMNIVIMITGSIVGVAYYRIICGLVFRC
jgi:molybdopterin-containing oxidoreductase family membrane subunit